MSETVKCCMICEHAKELENLIYPADPDCPYMKCTKSGSVVLKWHACDNFIRKNYGSNDVIKMLDNIVDQLQDCIAVILDMKNPGK